MQEDGYAGRIRRLKVQAGTQKLTDSVVLSEAIASLPPWKLDLDFCVLLLLSPLLAPVMLAIALFIKLTSRGPVIFRQTRVGYRGSLFVCYKFRSMHVGADAAVHQRHVENVIQSGAPMTKLDSEEDGRLIRGGGFLRATGLDELPQVFNILVGEMSLVGPRPCLPFEFDKYTDHSRHRFDTVPGLTGLWQVSGKNHTTFDEMIAYDLQYLRERSLRLDLWIMVRTIPVLLKQVAATIQAKWSKLRRSLARSQRASQPASLRKNQAPDRSDSTSQKCPSPKQFA
jgi:lipopolysaccharide/colanic/teichoic acid biosynthesis glycosyltransferase